VIDQPARDERLRMVGVQLALEVGEQRFGEGERAAGIAAAPGPDRDVVAGGERMATQLRDPTFPKRVAAVGMVAVEIP
jgi:hypothetical protein